MVYQLFQVQMITNTNRNKFLSTIPTKFSVHVSGVKDYNLNFHFCFYLSWAFPIQIRFAYLIFLMRYLFSFFFFVDVAFLCW